MTATIIGPGLVLFTPPNPRAVGRCTGPAWGSGTWASVLVPGCSHSGAQLPQAAQGKPRAGMVTAAPRTAAHQPQEARGRFSPSSESPRRARGQQQGAAVPEAPPQGRCARSRPRAGTRWQVAKAAFANPSRAGTQQLL